MIFNKSSGQIANTVYLNYFVSGWDEMGKNKMSGLEDCNFLNILLFMSLEDEPRLLGGQGMFGYRS